MRKTRDSSKKVNQVLRQDLTRQDIDQTDKTTQRQRKTKERREEDLKDKRKERKTREEHPEAEEIGGAVRQLWEIPLFSS